MIKFKDILEAISIEDNKVKIDYSNPIGLIKTIMGKNKYKDPFVTTYKGHKIFSAYGKSSSEANTEIMLALKGKSKILKIDSDILKQFIKRTAFYLWSRALKDKSIDLVVSIKSSSPLSNDFSKEFVSRIPNVLFLPYSIFKSEKEKIKIDDKASESQRKSLNRIINKDEDFQIKKVNTQMRGLVHDYMSISDELSKKIKDKNILIIDDYLTSGATFIDIFEVINRYNPKNVYGVTIFKAK